MYKFNLKWIPSAYLAFLCLSCQIHEEFQTLESSLSEISEKESGFELFEQSNSHENFRLGNWNFIFEETFESSDPFYTYVHKQFPASHSFKTVTSPIFRGERSGRFELRKSDDVVTSSGIRTEVLFQEQSDNDLWYSFGLYLPSEGFAKDRDNDILSQWIQSGMGGPATSFRVENDRFLLRTSNKTTNREIIDLGPATKNTWHRFIFRMVHSYSSSGLIEIWHNGNKILTRKAGNIYDGPLPRWKIGIYKPSWEDRNTDTKLRVVYFDNVRIGNSNSNFDEMNPSKDNNSGWGPFIPEISSLTLINARTNKDIKKHNDGETINYNFLATDRISFRADVNEKFDGSLYFELKGPKNHTYVDRVPPYALFGDDGNGKYAHGGGLPLGNYTLTITPYAGQSADGKIGNPKTYKFKIVDEEVVDESLPTVKEFILIQANINKKLWGIKDGSIINLSDIGTDKLTIETILTKNFDGEVVFNLSGKVKRESNSTSAPYTLYGFRDGNYNFGNTGLPVGTYKLEVTPVSNLGGKFVSGITETINFQVVNSLPDKDNILNASGEIMGFSLIKANTNTILGPIKDGDVIDLKVTSTHKLSVRANMESSFKGKVNFRLNGDGSRNSTVDASPYTLFGYSNGNYSFGTGLDVGNYSLTTTPISVVSGVEVTGSPVTIKFKVINSDQINEILSFTLIKANTNEKIGTIKDGDRLKMSDIGTHKLSIQANISSSFKGRVLFELSGNGNRRFFADQAPYTLFGYRDNNYSFGTGLPIGKYSLNVTPYYFLNGREVPGNPRLIKFEIY